MVAVGQVEMAMLALSLQGHLLMVLVQLGVVALLPMVAQGVLVVAIMFPQMEAQQVLDQVAFGAVAVAVAAVLFLLNGKEKT